MQINNTIDLSGNAGGGGSGEVGPAGPQGIQGETGPQGVPGIPGTDGVDGVDGVGGGGLSVEKLRFLKNNALVDRVEILLGGNIRYIPEVNKKIKKVTIALDNQTLMAVGAYVGNVTTGVQVIHTFTFTMANENVKIFIMNDEVLTAGEIYTVEFINAGSTDEVLNQNLNITIEVENV